MRGKWGIVSVPSQGIGCIEQKMRTYIDENVSVPSRGIGCITIINIVEDAGACFRPLTGHRMHYLLTVLSPSTEQVSVPSRGIGCINIVFRPLHGVLVSIPSRGIGCITITFELTENELRFPSPHGA